MSYRNFNPTFDARPQGGVNVRKKFANTFRVICSPVFAPAVGQACRSRSFQLKTLSSNYEQTSGTNAREGIAKLP